ncbi:Hypothetical protein R9X50_00296700 [Acrodontium crateriforme]|uniref:Uncharacterized protein n=1 Tax=Acrodontium crateriforme TaxID=150365 RepID=A0AAQ3M2L4_9PEZI|nr:Hypothetical protein R9X50_00296700 [Acrodontium crateriforme]
MDLLPKNMKNWFATSSARTETDWPDDKSARAISNIAQNVDRIDCSYLSTNFPDDNKIREMTSVAQRAAAAGGANPDDAKNAILYSNKAKVVRSNDAYSSIVRAIKNALGTVGKQYFKPNGSTMKFEWHASSLEELDNSSRSSLRVPGFGAVPVDYQLPVQSRFVNGFNEWRQSPTVTAQELAMVAVMDRLTDKHNWFVDIFDNAVVAQWRTELDRDLFIANPRLFKGKTWDWCVQELRDKAIQYENHRHVRVLDTGSCVCKGDSPELQSLSKVLQCATIPLARNFKASRNQPRSQVRQEWRDLWKDAVVDKRPKENGVSPAVMCATCRSCYGLESETPSPAEEALEALSANVSEDDSSADESMLHDDSFDIGISGASIRDEVSTSSDEFWRTRRVLENDSDFPNLSQSAQLVANIVDPLLYPLVYGRTLVLQDGDTVPLPNMLASYGAAKVAPLPMCQNYYPPHWGVQRNSRRYQSLPCEVAFTDNEADFATISVKITSYINGLHPEHVDVYRAIEQVLSLSVPLWNDCLIRGERGLRDRAHEGQLGHIPARIITYGVEWENELPEWATAFRVPAKSRKEDYFEAKTNLSASTKKRKRKEEELRRMFSDVVGKEDLELPPSGSVLWQLAKEYLERPESQPAVNKTRSAAVSEEEAWKVGDERTWGRLCEKAERILCHKHPEPGTAFTYEEWKSGSHNSQPIVEPVVQKPKTSRRPPYVLPHVQQQPVILQDQFRDQGLQVIIGINSIELTPKTPAYGPRTAARAATSAARAAKKFAKAKIMNEPVELDDDPDVDGWQVLGKLNEHIAAVAILVFDAENITEPRVAFRQKISMSLSLYRHKGWFDPPENAPPYYDHEVHGPAHAIGKDQEPEALAEILGLPDVGKYGGGDPPIPTNISAAWLHVRAAWLHLQTLWSTALSRSAS